MVSLALDATLEVSSTPSTTPATLLSNAADAASLTAPEPEVDAPQHQVEMANTTGNAKRGEGEAKRLRDCSAGARDLDMLADTVRSIVTDVVGSVGTPVNEEGKKGESEDKPLIQTEEDAADVAIDMATNSGSEEALPLVTEPNSALRDNNKEITDVSMEEITEDASDGDAIAVLSTSDGVAAVGGSSSKRLLVDTEETDRAPKKKKRAEYSEETRALCVRRHQIEGASYAAISKELGIPHDTVRAIVRKAKRTGSVSSAPRSGRPRKTSGIVDKVILEALKANKQCSARSIQQELLRVFGVKISPETVRRRVLEHTKQRIQSVSGGVSSDVPTVEEVSNYSTGMTGVMFEVSTPTEDKPQVANTSLSNSVSFQRLLHEEGRSTPEAAHILSLAPAITKDNSNAQPAIGANTSPALTVSGAIGNSGIPRSQSAEPFQSEDELVPQKRQRSEYSIATREQCVALRAQGHGYRRIGKSLNMPHTTVRAIVEKAQRTGSVLPAKRSGRPRKTDDIVDKVILQAVKTNEKSSARVIKEQLQAAYGVRISCETIRRRVKDHSRHCMLTASSRGISETLPNDDTAFRQHASQQQELLAVAMTDSSSIPAANIIAFDENGVHL
ncbi:hypothetical protein PR001_g14276 [Phytophthora rubi]|uniref:Transposase IS30-like HTH domain-containing protein n=1 Tax=Phytophthora rubi TaxID=129364 RepID=A0A6A3L369_9STRA|nr:hypothetical protein PR002_g14793 [Phytophthora rubi]KAE9017896.1 hypothetical protein PR001_g14276 [Phytophthora rubi]